MRGTTVQPDDSGPSESRAEALDDALSRALLDGLYRTGTGAHPGVGLATEDFRAEVRRRALERDPREPEAPRERLARMARLGGGADLYLAIACERRAAGAWERLTTEYVPRLARALTAQGVPFAEADALAADAPGDLLQPPEDPRARTRIGLYRGLSSLFTFLKVAVLRRWTNARRTRRPASLEQLGEVADEAAGPAPGPGPVESVAGREAAARAEALLGEAWRALTPKEALALLYKHRDGLPQTTIAALLQVGEPRVSRLLASGVQRLRTTLAGVPTLREEGLPAEEWAAVRAVLERRLATLDPALPPTGAAFPVPRTHDAP